MTAPPLPFRWEGDGFKPLPRFAKECDRHFVVGEVYQLVEHHARSQNSHNHYFASLHEAWLNLPEHLGERFPSAEHLRKFALIKAGYADERSIVASSKAEALRLAAFLRPMDEFAIVTVSEAVVTVYTAKSQSHKAMGKTVFQQSKDAVLGIVSAMISTAPSTLSAHAGRAA